MKRILVCTDGSNYSTEACRYAAWISKQTQAEIVVLYVTDLRQFKVPVLADLSGSIGVQPYDGLIDKLREVERYKATYIEEATMEVFQESGIADRVTFHHETGLLVDEIDSHAEEADLILLGKRGENANFATEHLGSTLERVVRAVSKPCLVTSREFKAIQRVAIAYDGGPSCMKALDFISENELFKALDLHLITVADGHGENEASAKLKDAERRLNGVGLHPVCQVLTGEVETVVPEYVRRTKIDLLIAGAYGHSRIRELLIGSTTTEFLRRCHVPVLCFR